MNLSDFDYHLPEERIAQSPAEPRDSSRLLVLNRATGERLHHHFYDLPMFLRNDDILVMNQTRVIPARLSAIKQETGGKVEILLLRQLDSLRWNTLIGGRRVLTGTTLQLDAGTDTITATVESEGDGAQRILVFSEPISPYLQHIGELPLPPYIQQSSADPARYQTVYARTEGSAAAPTAGLHFTSELLDKLQSAGIELAYCTLHVGLDTFAPVRVENIAEHKMHREYAELTAETATKINRARASGGRIVAVGTTSARTLETAAIRAATATVVDSNDAQSVRQTLENIGSAINAQQAVIPIQEETDLFITPGYQFRAVDAMITNFHLPKSTLLMMLSALVGRELLLETYQEAIEQAYRFYSFGDAMLIL